MVSRNYWLGYLFHITDVENAAKILSAGELLSRAALDRSGLRWVDAASSNVIQQTRESFLGFVRLYFRPKTPAAYHMEGIKPLNRLYAGRAHCPLPVYFVFDACEVLTKSATRFSDGNIAHSATNIFENAEDFANLPFYDIYHDRGWAGLEPSRKNEIRNRRHAEVIVSNELALDTLRAVVCRSQAEYDTLRNLLCDAWDNWKSKIRPASKPARLFYRERLFVESATLHGSSAKLKFNLPRSHKDYGPFNFRVTVRAPSTGETYTWEHNFENIRVEIRDLQLRFDLSAIRWNDYSLMLEVDGKLAYLGNFTPEIPF